ncbi:MAG TPA: serine/threonine-protein kinase [Planctomycetaceae bacterium]|nr:serine/threonine-protein kinase [Planctomycetaceae bacterium]
MPSSTVAEFLQNRNRNDVKGTLQSNRSESVEIARATTATDKSGIQKYQVMETLAEGGMGQVVKAFQRELKIHVAIKVLPPFSDAGQDEIERFDREIETLARLTHPNIVQAKDAGDWEGRRFLAMEFLDGLDVSKVAKRTPEFPVADACELIRQAAVGLHFAHEKGVVHRDVKPSNLMLAWSPSGIEDKIAMVKILDLGLARLLMENSTLTGGLTLSGQILGT